MGGLIFFAHDFVSQRNDFEDYQTKKEARKVGLGWRSQIAVRDRDKARLGAENAVFSTHPLVTKGERPLVGFLRFGGWNRL